MWLGTRLPSAAHLVWSFKTQIYWLRLNCVQSSWSSTRADPFAVSSSLATLEPALDRRDSPLKPGSIYAGSCVLSVGVHQASSCRWRALRIGSRGVSGSETETVLCFGSRASANVWGFRELRPSFYILVLSSRFRALEPKYAMQDLHLIASANHFSSFNFQSFKPHFTAWLATYNYRLPQFSFPYPTIPPNISVTPSSSMNVTHPRFELVATAAG